MLIDLQNISSFIVYVNQVENQMNLVFISPKSRETVLTVMSMFCPTVLVLVASWSFLSLSLSVAKAWP